MEIAGKNALVTGAGQGIGEATALMLATAVLDRLLHHATTLNIKGESYRLKEKRRAGLLGRPEPATEAPSPMTEEA